MKHTLKSLLITTVLTLLTVFGSETLSEQDDKTTTTGACVATTTQPQRSQPTLKRLQES